VAQRELMINAPDNTSRTVRLDAEEFSLGRAHSNDLCYPEDASLSRQHLVFKQDGEDWTVCDLGSKNGTLVNGVRIDRVSKLRPGDRVTAGRLTMMFADPEQQNTAERVEFYVGSETETPVSATVMTSLEGLLSGEISQPTPSAVPKETPSTPSEAANAFQSPVVGALIRAGRELAGHRPLAELFTLILDLSINAVGAERGILMTLEGEELVTRATHGEGFRISTAVRDRVIKDKTSLLVRDVMQDRAFRERLSISEQQIRTMMAVPLQTDERAIGLIYVDSRFFVRDFTPDDLNLLTVLANVAAIRIEHQRLVEVERVERQLTIELNQAAKIQRGILPSRSPEIPGVELAGHNAACRTVGGDYYDFLVYSEGRVGLVLGDVAGKGMPAAMLMANLQARVQVLSEDPSDIAGLVSRLDRSISSNCPSNRFITLFFGVLDSATGEMQYTNAGHNPPLLIRADGKLETLSGGGTVLGMLPELGYEQRSCKLEPGDMLAIFSDGVTEAVNPDDEEYGEERLARLLTDNRERAAETLVEMVNQSLDEFCAGAPPADDITLVVARRLS
jgi:serine phosphatase RsbU (regulator of sigma subunit)/pSer/pThr/pTyr-binding forkhead associated (FHA) protein